jgi:hypothetical protein
MIKSGSVPPYNYDVNLNYNLEDHPEYARLIGQIAATWGIIEWQMCALFAALLRAPPWQAQTAFYALSNNKARRDLVRSLNNKLAGNTETRKKITDVLKRIAAAAEKRNPYMHGLWSIEGDKVYIHNAIGNQYPRGSKQLVKAKDLESVLKFLDSTARATSKFTYEYSVNRPLPVIGSEPRPTSLKIQT